MKHLLIAGALALGLSGCAALDGLEGFGERDPVRETIAGCNTITGALNVLTPNKDRLTVQQVATVNRVVDVSEPICTAEDPPATAADLISDLAAQLVTIQTTLAEGS